MKFISVRNQSGFTLIEIMVVVVIIGLLATMILPNVMGNADRANEVKARADIRTIEGQLALYKLDNFEYPTTAQGIKALVTDPGSKGNWRSYLSKVPTDPWKNEFHYQRPGQKNTNSYDLWSLGSDGAPGGEGTAKDIGNWED